MVVPRGIACGGKLTASALVVVVAVLCVGAATAGRALAGDECASATVAEPRSVARAVACAINRERAARGLRRLRWRPALARAARRHSEEMVARRFFSHVSPSGARLRGRIAANGYLCGAQRWRLGEVLAWGTGSSGTPAGAVSAWLASPPHRDVVLSPGYRDLGVGVADGVPLDAAATPEGLTYTAELGARRRSRTAACAGPSAPAP